MHHSKLVEYLVKWISCANHLNLPIELYFHVFKHLLTESAIPFKDLGQYIQANRKTFMDAIERFGLKKPRMEKLKMYINDFLVKCDSEECLQGYHDYDGELLYGASDDSLAGTPKSYKLIYDKPDGEESSLQGISELGVNGRERRNGILMVIKRWPVAVGFD
ncbi:hypothetical protein BDQ17DRAFT_1548600 [Cyathus striatus]|nr:hypothetical protein BDQ17DRAFT_1548600 [Cyathus striatus]